MCIIQLVIEQIDFQDLADQLLHLNANASLFLLSKSKKGYIWIIIKDKSYVSWYRHVYCSSRNMCNKFHLKLMNGFMSYEVRLKFCDSMIQLVIEQIVFQDLAISENTDQLHTHSSHTGILIASREWL